MPFVMNAVGKHHGMHGAGRGAASQRAKGPGRRQRHGPTPKPG